jgi:transposase
MRRVLDAVNYRWCTGCSWRMLPHDFGPWQTVYRHFRKWQNAGLLSSIRDVVLQRRLRHAERSASERSL